LIYVLKFIEKLDFTINLPALEIFVSTPNVDRVKHIHAKRANSLLARFSNFRIGAHQQQNRPLWRLWPRDEFRFRRACP
jgi:hypothetical protein